MCSFKFHLRRIKGQGHAGSMSLDNLLVVKAIFQKSHQICGTNVVRQAFL